jgi:hypothetical protein
MTGEEHDRYPVLATIDECHDGLDDPGVLEAMRQLMRASRDDRLDLRLDPRDLLQGRPLAEIGLTKAELLARVRSSGISMPLPEQGKGRPE